jgi:RNA binding exosome subunit
LFLDKKEFKEYWYETGTPTFLIEQIKKKSNDLEPFAKSQEVGMAVLKGDGSDNVETIALLFQTGYLTVKKKGLMERGSIYTLDFPNFEVKNAFLTSLIKAYMNKESREVERANENICEKIKRKDAKGLEESLRILFASIPYDLHIGKEAYYHSLFLMMMRLNGYEVEGEVHTDKGRIDAVLKKGNDVIVVKIKYSKEQTTEEMIKEAMEQIKDRKYYEKYVENEVSLLGIGFGKGKEIGCRFERV